MYCKEIISDLLHLFFKRTHTMSVLVWHCSTNMLSQIVDMRWGIRDEASNDHLTTKLCLSEIQACKDISIGPYFVVST